MIMSPGSWRIKPSEVERTLKSIVKTGLRVRAVEVGTDGTIKIDIVEIGEPTPPDQTSEMLRKLI